MIAQNPSSGQDLQLLLPYRCQVADRISRMLRKFGFTHRVVWKGNHGVRKLRGYARGKVAAALKKPAA
jgi:hypothetical protein